MDLDFDKQFEGKADLFLRKWETNIIPKLMKVAALEMSEDLENPSTTGNNTDGMLGRIQEDRGGNALITFMQWIITEASLIVQDDLILCKGRSLIWILIFSCRHALLQSTSGAHAPSSTNGIRTRGWMELLQC